MISDARTYLFLGRMKYLISPRAFFWITFSSIWNLSEIISNDYVLEKMKSVAALIAFKPFLIPFWYIHYNWKV